MLYLPFLIAWYLITALYAAFAIIVALISTICIGYKQTDNVVEKLMDGYDYIEQMYNYMHDLFHNTMK